MNILKRNGQEVAFDLNKIKNAITKANCEVNDKAKLLPSFITAIAEEIEMEASESPSTLTVENIQDMVVRKLAKYGAVELAMTYQNYRYRRELNRKANTTDEAILSLIDLTNEELKQENSNKNATINSTQRDYMAGEVSKDLTKRILLPEDIVAAHEQGLIHVHDMDYFVQREHNCDLVNLEDMVQNGTVISEIAIEKPHSFATACNVATQIVAQVASSQFGGQSISLAHLAPFVDISRQKLYKEVIAEREENGDDMDENKIQAIVNRRLMKEIKAGIQTIQYQLVTLQTTNGQTPFVTVFMYLNEAKNEQEKADLALMIEETLKQRIQGIKNEQGVWVTPAFPQLGA